jgi:hypothetical protein
MWTAMVDDFLKSQNLVLRDTLLQISEPVASPPSYLGTQGRDEFQTYLLSAPHKAFVASPAKGYGTSVGRRTAAEAEKLALEDCRKLAPKTGPCTIVMVDDEKPPN